MNRVLSSNRRTFLLRALSAGALVPFLPACNIRPQANRWPFQIGDLVVCGKLNYTVLEVEYKSQLGSGPIAQLARNIFIAIRMQITTSVAGTFMPLLRLESEKEEFIGELDNASGLEGWLGSLRRLEPGTTEIGWIVFDTPPGKYGLWLSDGVLEDEKKAAVLIPVQVTTDPTGTHSQAPLPLTTPVLR